MTGHIKLKPCPFCGSENVKSISSNGLFYNGLFYCICGECGARTEPDISLDNAIEYWETRWATPLPDDVKEAVDREAVLEALEWLKSSKVTIPDVGVFDQIRYVEHVSNVKKTIRALLEEAAKGGG